MHEDYSSRWLGDLLDRTAAERVRSRMNTRPSLLRTLKSRRSEVLESSRQSHRRALRRRLGMELLERRELLAAITWSNSSGGDWGLASNWSPAQVPTAIDDVIIPSLSGAQTITVSGTRVARTIEVRDDEKLQITGGTLTVSAAEAVLKGTGSFEVAGGTLALAGNGWSNTSTLVLASGTLSLRGTFTTAGLGTFTRANGGTVRLEGALNNTGSTLNIDSSTGSWQVVNGQITGGAIDYSDGEQLLFLANENNRLTDVTLLDELQLIESSYVELYGTTTFPSARLTSTIGGAGVWTHLAVAPGYVLPGSVFFAGVGTNNRLLGVDGAGTMTIPAGVTVETTPDFGGSAFIGSTNQTVINQGTIRSGTANRTLTFQPQSLQNSGIIRSENGGALVINAITFANNVGGLVAATNATLTLAGNWSNALGTLSSDNSNLFLRGTFTTTGLGTFTRTNGGTVRLEGALNNTGSTLNINSSTGSWLVANGQITGGTIAYSDGEQLLFLSDDRNRLTDVTLLDELQLIESSYVELYGATTFPSARLIMTIGGAGVRPHLAVAPGFVLPGNVFFAGASTGDRLLYVDGAGTMTIPAGVSVETTPDFGGSAFVGTTNQTVINQGTIRSGTANCTLTIQPQTLQNSGTIQAENGGALVINAITFANNVGGLVAATNATLTLAGNWSNALGTLSSDNSNLFLRGTFTTAGLGAFTRTNGGTVRLEGALNNTSSTLNINSSTGSWQVVNGQITGGAIDYSDGEQLLFLANENNRLTDVTLLDELQLIESSYVELYGSTTFPTARLIVTIGGAGVQPQLAVAPGYVLPGNVYFAGIHPNNRTLRVDGVGTMTIPAGVSVETTPDFGGSAFVGSTNQTVINQGTIRSGTANRTLTIQPQALQNFGTIQAENSASMVVNSGAFENQGALTATGAAVLTVRPTVFSNFLDLTSLGNNRFGVTLQGGTYEVDGGTLRLFQGTNTAHSFVVQKLNAELIFVGANPRVYGNTTNTDSAIAEVSEIGAGGTLRLRDGAFYGPPGELLVRGTVEVDATSQFGLAPSAPITNDGLESHFAADGNDSNSAAGAGTITATRVGATFAPGVEGQGYSFDGQNDYVTIPADPSLNNANLTVSAWYKLDQLLTGPRLILSKTIGSGTLNSYAVWLDGDFLRFGIGNAGGLDFQSAAITRQVGKWNHVAMAFSDNNDLVQLFHNGSLLHSFSTTRSISYDNGRPHVIGADIENGNPAFFFPGVIDEVRYYDRALTATEIFNIAANSPGLTTRVRQVDGTVQIDGALASFRDYRLEGGTLFGSGLLPANLEQTGGLLAPGNSPGCLEIDGNYNLEAAGTLQIEIDGPTVCTQYDQLQVDGNVTLAGTLNVVLNPTYSPTIGQKFLILENDLTDAISGQFLYDGNALRERQVFLVNGNQLFRISYIAGDGNDVELEFLGKGTLVSNTNDAGFGSLRQAVADANASSGHDLIAFAIDDALLVGGRYLIEAGDGLLVSDMSTIDATTQFDFAGDPLVELRNESVVPSPTGFAFPLDGFLSYDASGSSLRGFSLTGWANGVTVNANDVLIAGNYFGIPLDGSSGGGNEIGIQASSDYTGIVIGGIESRDRNVIANSSVAGIDLFAISGVVIQGNYIGTDPTGMSNLPNQRGIRIQRSIVGLADDNRIGSLATGAGNLISGNTIAGVEIDGGFAGIENNQVIGNWIGVDATGNAALPNGVGVLLINSTFATTVASNVISGNNTHGILITDGAVGNTIAGNILGLNADGTTAVPNLNHGISIENGSANNVIGGLDTDSRNIISGNNLFGVSVTSSNDNRILGNYLGLDRTGALQLANGLGAISLNNASFTSIGSNGTELNRNRIVGADASQTGISLENQSNSNAITANHFGLSASDQPLGYLNNVILISDSDENTIGGTTEAERNVLGQYTSHGILITNGSELNVVTGNYVGVHPDGNSPLFTESHQTTGIALINSPNNFIGLATIGAGNLISGNQTGIFIGGTQSTSNEIIGNAIGLNADGNAAIGNEQGILIGDARNTRVGGVAVGQRNIISGNRIGIGIYGDNRDTTISGNWIGTDASGDTQTGMAVGNLESGIVFQGGIRGVIRDNLIVQAGVFGPSPPEPPGAIDVQAGNVVLSRNLIHNNYKKSITTAVSPGAVTITQARLDGIVLGKIEDATPFTTFLVEFFSASEEGQAEVYVGSGAVVTNEDGFAEFEIGGLGDLIPGKFLTATITGTRTEGGDDRNTSPIAQGKVPQVAIIRGLPDFSREGTSISAQAFAIDSTITGYAITGYLWQVLQDNQPYLTGNEASIQFAPEDQGIYRVQLTLTLTDINGTGDQQTVVLGPHLITVSNVAPSPQFEIHPNRPTANQPVTFSSTSSDPGQWDVLTHAWEVRYGSDVVFSQAADPNATEVSFTPTVGGIYFVTLTVDDNDGGPTGARSLQRLFEVAGLPGQAAIIAPTSGSEGQTIRARVPESELQRTEQLDFTWRVEKRDSLASPPVNFDFTIPSEGVIEFVPDDNGIYRVYLTISDSSGSLPETEHDIEVSNASPTVVLRSGTPLAEVGLPITLEAEINDPGFADTHEVAWVVERNGVTVATGNNSSGPYEFTFTPTQSGVYKVIATATDDDFSLLTNVGRGSGQKVFYVSDSALALTIQSPTTSLLEGERYPFNAILPSSATVSSYQWTAVDVRGRTVAEQAGSGPTVAVFEFVPPRGGEFLVVLEAIFTDGRVARAISDELNATGLAPTIVDLSVVTPPGNTPVTEGMEVTVRANATDPGETVGLTYRWELMRPGGGWVEVEGLARRPSDMRFVPTNNGLHQIRVTVTDSQGLAAPQELVRFSTTGIEVENLAPNVRLLVVGNTDTNVTFRAQATDPGADDQPGLRYAWSVNGGAFTDPSASDTRSVDLSGLHTLRVRVSDDTTFTEVSSYILQGTSGIDNVTLTSTDAANAVAANAQQIVYLALDGDDQITVASGISLPVLIFGGAGNDTLNASAATGPVLLDGGDGDDILRGGTGNDLLIAGSGTNQLYGGDGNNRFIGGGNDTMVGGVQDDYYEVHFSTVVIQDTGGGFNTIDLNAAQQGVSLDFGLTDGTAQEVFAGSTLSLDGNFQRLVGSPHNDQFQSDIPGTELFGGAGNDQLIANGTDIVLNGGDGDDEFILSDASATILGGSGNNSVLGTLEVGGVSDIDLGNGNGTVNIVGAAPAVGESLAKVTIVGGLGANTITAERVQGTIYAYTGREAGAISEFGSATSPSASLISINNSSDIDIFGSALPGNRLVVTNSQDISIFGGGGDEAVLTDVTRATIDGSLFGSATGPQAMTATITSSSDIDIFGSAQPNVTLTSTITSSSDIDIFGSARQANQITVTASSDISIFGMAEGSIEIGDDSGNLVERTSIAISDFGSATPKTLSITLNQSQDIDIFGSASPTGTPISAIVNASSDISIFGSAARQSSIVVTASQDIDIFGLVDGEVRLGPEDPNATGDGVTRAIIDASGFGSVSPNTSSLTLLVNNGSDIDIFGGVSPNGSALNATILNSSDIDIFGSVRGGTITVTTSQDIDIFGQGSESVSLDDVDRAAVFTETLDIFGSANPRPALLVSVLNQSSDISIFGSATRNANIVVTNSSDIDIFGGAAVTELDGNTYVGDVATLNGVINATVVAGVFGSAVPTGSKVLNLTVVNNSSDIDIFGSAKGPSSLTVSASQDISIFGGYGDEVSLEEAMRVRVEGGVFGSATGSGSNRGLAVNILSGSSDIGIFGTDIEDSVTVSGGLRVGVSLRGGNDQVTIVDAEQFVGLFDDEDDYALVESGSDILLYLAEGNDRARVEGGENVRVIGGEGNDEFLLVDGTLIDIDGGLGEDYLLVVGGSSLTARLDDGNDRSTMLAGQGSLIAGGDGGDVMKVVGSLGRTLSAGQVHALIDGQGGDDQLSVLPLFSLEDPLGSGSEFPLDDAPVWINNLSTEWTSPMSTRYPSSIALVGGVGNDRLELWGNQRLYGMGGDGNDELHLLGGSTSTLAGGDGNDRFYLRSEGVDNYVFGGEDQDEVYAYAGSKLAVFAEGGDDFVEFAQEAGQSVVQSFARGGAGDDNLEVRAGRDLVIAGDLGSNNLAVFAGNNIVAAGGVGNDSLVAWGGDNVVLLGESGNDLLQFEGGIGVILSGGDGNDVLEAIEHNVDLYGDDGDDTYAIHPTPSSGLIRMRELLYIDGTNFEAEARGSDTIDLSRFTTGATLDLRVIDSEQIVIPGQMSLLLRGAFENVLGTSGDDVLYGNDESNILEGGPGNDQLFGFAGDDILNGGDGDDALVGGDGNDTYIFATGPGVSIGSDTVIEAEQGGIDLLDFSGMPVGLGILDLGTADPQVLASGLLTLRLRLNEQVNAPEAWIEEVRGTPFNDAVQGNDLDNRFELLGGDDVVDGGGGDDIYVFRGSQLGSLIIEDLAEYAGLRTLDFASFDAPIDLDLEWSSMQDLGGELILTLVDPSSIANVIGTSYNDTIRGNDRDNIIYGAAGSDLLDGRGGNDTLVADLPQVVLLDFDSAFRLERGDYDYSPEERQLVLEAIEARFAAFNWRFTLDESEARAWTTSLGRSYVTLAFSEGRGGGVSGDAGEIDFRNINRSLISQVNINALKTTVAELLGSEHTPEEYSNAIVALSAHIAAHELGHTAGLRHADAFGPIGSGYFEDADLSRVYPEYNGLRDALDTPFHLMASPASVGTTILDALGNTFFGARESIKLAFNEIGHTIREVNAPFQSHSVRDATAFDLGGLSPLYVPNLVPESGHTYSGKVFDVSAIAVVGELKHEGSVSETDVYRFTGRPGEWVNIELIANGLRPVRGDLFDGRIRVYRANGELLAENDDEFEGTKDATLFDVKLPEDGAEDEEYYIEVSLSEQPAFGQGGRYELFVSRFRDLPAADGGQVAQAPGDTLIGGVGSNVIRGGAANDKVFATQGAVNDLVFGQGGSDTFDYLGLDYTVGNLDSVESVVNQNIAPTAVLDGVPTVPIDSGTEFTVRLESPYFDPSQSDTAAGFRFAFELKRDDGTVVAGSLTESYANASTIASRDFVVTSGGNYIVKARILDQQSGYRDYVRNLEVLGGPENEPPTEIVMDVTTVAENQPIGTLVGTLTAIDPDEDDQHTFTLVDGEGDSDNAIFEIVGREIRTLAVLDYEAKSQYSIRVRATDSSGSTLDRSFALNVLNIPELIGDIVVGDGTIQRSLIKQLTMVFDSELEIDSGAFKVQQRLFDANNLLVPKDVPILVQQTPLPNGHWQVQITFVFSGTDYPVRSGSLALQDGNYQLIIDGSKIRSNQSLLAFDADGNGTQGGIRTLGANEADRFYAFFGDLRGIRAVGAVDNNELRKTLGKTSSHPDFNGLFDANGDNAIGAFDNNEMRKSLLKRTLEWR